MSRKPSENSDEDADSVDADPTSGDPDHDLNDSPQQNAAENPEPSDDDFDDEEFSLDKLSQAYAEVLKNRGGAEVPPTDADSAKPELVPDSESEEDASSKQTQESDDNAGCPISPESIIESILFVGAPKDVTLNSRKVAAVLRDVSPKEVTKIVRELNAKYESEDAAYRIQSDGGVFRMVLDPKLVEFQQHFFGRNRQVRLSQAAIDVMAIVAYNQPVTRDLVDEIRGRPSGSVLGQLLRRQLIYLEPGKSNPKVKYYATTDRFLDLFRLQEIDDLPQSHEVSDMDELAD